MINPYEWLADRIVAHPRVVGAVAVLVFVVALFGLTLVSMETGDDTYLDKTTSRAPCSPTIPIPTAQRRS